MDNELIITAVAGAVTIVVGFIGNRYRGKLNQIKQLVYSVDDALEDGTIDATEMKIIWGQLKSIF